MWVEHLARDVRETDRYPFPFLDGELDFRPLLQAVVADRLKGASLPSLREPSKRGIAHGLAQAAKELAGQQKRRHDRSLRWSFPERAAAGRFKR